jgi:hypothetical protein
MTTIVGRNEVCIVYRSNTSILIPIRIDVAIMRPYLIQARQDNAIEDA